MGSSPFSITERERTGLTSKLLESVEPHDKPFSVHLVESLDDAAFLGLDVTSKVFGQTFGNGPELLEAEYREFLPSMLHVVVCDTSAKIPVASLGIIRTPAAQLKTIVDVAKSPWNQSVIASCEALEVGDDDRGVWDVATLAVLPSARIPKMSVALFHSLYVSSAASGTKQWVAILDDPVLRGVNAVTRKIFKPLGAARSAPYLGSVGSTPVVARVPGPQDTRPPTAGLSTGSGLETLFAFDSHILDMREAARPLLPKPAPSRELAGLTLQSPLVHAQ